MKATGVVRKIDELGRVVIPKELRKVYGIEEGTPVEFYSTDNAIVIKQYRRGCLVCANTENTVDIKGMVLCKECISLFAERGSSL